MRGGGVAGFFAAVEALTWREMCEVAELLALQLEETVKLPRATIAQALADASDSHADAGDE